MQAMIDKFVRSHGYVLALGRFVYEGKLYRVTLEGFNGKIAYTLVESLTIEDLERLLRHIRG